MLKKITVSIIIAALSAALCQQRVTAQETFQQPVVLFNQSGGSSGFLTNPFTGPYSNGYGFGGGFAPGLVTPYGMSPLAYGSGYSGFGRNWIGRAGGFGGYGGYGNRIYPGGLGIGGFGGNPFIGSGGYGSFGYPGGFGGYGYPGGFGWGGFGGYGNIGYPGGFGLGGYGGNPFTGSSGELGTLQGSSQVIQIGPSKSSGNYYQPSTVDTSASGSYYASSAPAQAIPAAPRPAHSGWTSPSGNGDFWGSGGSGLPKDLNSVPWNK